MNEDETVRVDETGIALLHAGNVVMAAPGAEVVGHAIDDPNRVVHYHFPVHVEVAHHDLGTIERAIERRLNALADGFESA